MSSNSSVPVIMVMTARGPARILAERGTQAWHLNPGNARRYDYVVCVQNRNNGNWGEATEPHLMAFLIGKISTVELSTESLEFGKPLRYIIKMSEYARISVQAPAWVGRNPVRYADLAYLGIQSLDDLQWQTMPQSGEEVESQAAAAEAVGEEIVEEVDGDAEPYAPEIPPGDRKGIVPAFRQQLAAAMGVLPSQVHIRIDLVA